MKRRFLTVLVALLGANLTLANDPPELKEVLELLRANLAGANEADLNRAAVQGLLAQLGPKVSLVGEPGSESTNTVRVNSTVYDQAYAYIRLGQIGAASDKHVLGAYKNLASTNRLR